MYFISFNSRTFSFIFQVILGDPGADSEERREEPQETMSNQTSSKRSPPFWRLIGARKLLCFSVQSEGRTAATVWNWSCKTLSPGALLAVLYFSSFNTYFSARLDFPSPPLSAPGSPRMISVRVSGVNTTRSGLQLLIAGCSVAFGLKLNSQKLWEIVRWISGGLTVELIYQKHCFSRFFLARWKSSLLGKWVYMSWKSS